MFLVYSLIIEMNKINSYNLNYKIITYQCVLYYSLIQVCVFLYNNTYNILKSKYNPIIILLYTELYLNCISKFLSCSHKKRRALIKKEKRRVKRQALAKERDQSKLIMSHNLLIKVKIKIIKK